MPELPEVEAARRLVERECVGKQIQKAIVQDDEKVIQSLDPQSLASSLQNRTITSANRLGKHLWLDFSDGKESLLFHFGMTGGLIIRGRGGAHYQRYAVDDAEWPPRFVKVELDFTDGTQLAFADSRRFARIRSIQDPGANPPLASLGFDPLLSMPTLSEFSESLSTQRRAIKALLLDQSFSAGIGNWVADEVLYQSRVHPEQPANTLTEKEIESLHKHIKEVCEVASDAGAEAESMPEEWLFHYRWSKGSAKKPRIGGHAIEHITVGGRTSAYVPAMQKLRKAGASGSSTGAGKKIQKTAVTQEKKGKGMKSQKTVVTQEKRDEEGIHPPKVNQMQSLSKQAKLLTKERGQQAATRKRAAVVAASEQKASKKSSSRGVVQARATTKRPSPVVKPQARGRGVSLSARAGIA